MKKCFLTFSVFLAHFLSFRLPNAISVVSPSILRKLVVILRMAAGNCVHGWVGVPGLREVNVGFDFVCYHE